MTLKTGWCLDEIQARDLGYPASADRLHDKCGSDTCTCEQHQEKR